MKKSSKKCVSSLLCAAMMMTTVIAGPMGASAAEIDSLERDRLVGSHLGQSLTSVSIEDTGVNARVDYVTGNVFFSAWTPISNFALCYNSQDETVTELGGGFTSLFQRRVDIYNGEGQTVPAEDDIMVYQMEDGKRLFLDRHETEAGEWYWGDNYYTGLRFEPDGYSYGYPYRYQKFGKAGEQTEFAIQRIDHQEILRVTNGAGGGYSPSDIYGYINNMIIRGIHFDYIENPLERKPRTEKITCTFNDASYATAFRYNAQGNLSHYQESESMANLAFAYDGDSSRVTEITDVLTGNVTQIQYAFMDGLYKATLVQVSKADGTIVEQKQFAYGNGQTVIIDKDGNMSVKTY